MNTRTELKTPKVGMEFAMQDDRREWQTAKVTFVDDKYVEYTCFGRSCMLNLIEWEKLLSGNIKTKRFGFYSSKSASEFGYCTYSTPSGKYVNVTVVLDFDNITDGRYGFKDALFVGEVCEYVSGTIKTLTGEFEY